jgi:peptidoglycan LD-endopeptidase LytH
VLTPVLSWIVLLFSIWVPTLMAPPIAGLSAKDLHDTFDQRRGLAKHEAIDIMEPRGTPVRAVVDGTIARLFLSKPGGNTIYLFDGDGVFCYYYGHLDHYASNLREGMRVSHGQVIAYVGSTGDADPSAPHLHFTIFKLGLERHWWRGTPVNPYPALIHLLSRAAR